MSVTPDGDYLIADSANQRIRFVDAASPLPTFTGTSPASPADDNSPRILGTASPASMVRLYTDSACAGTPAGSDVAANFLTPGIGVGVADNSTTTFFATATDIGGNTSPCSTSSATYVERQRRFRCPSRATR